MSSVKRKKIVLPLLMLILCILAWQLYLLLGHRLTPKATPVTPTISSQLPSLKLDNEKQVAAQEAIPVLPQVSQHVILDQDTKPPVEFEPTQREYVRLMSEYQVAQIKRLIAQDYESIARANRNAAQAMVETEKLSRNKGIAALPQPTLNSTLGQERVRQDYRLVYTGQQYGKWGATLRYRNKLVDLAVGNTAPDGAKVVAINQDSVVLQHDRIQRTVGFYNISEKRLPQHKATSSLAVNKVKSKPSKIASIRMKVKKPVALRSKKKQATPTVHVKKRIVQPLLKKAKPKIVKSTLSPFIARTKVIKLTKRTVTKHIHKKVKFVKKPTQPAMIEITRDHQVVAAKHARIKPSLKRHYTTQEQALFQVSPNNYAIQLMGHTHKSAIKKFMIDHHLIKSASYYKTYRNGKPWYVIIYHQYPGAQPALHAVRKLPIGLHRWSPFVKSYSQIQSELRKVA